MVIHIETIYLPDKLLEVCKKIEIKMGRNLNSKKNYPRIIDIDILSFDDCTINTTILRIPHPLLHQRKFVLEPWCEISSTYYLDKYKKNIKCLLKDTKDNSKVVKL